MQGDAYVVAGEIRNTTAFVARNVHVAGTVYDADGKAIETAETTLPGELRPGAQGSFLLVFRNDPRIIRYYVTITSG